MKAPESMGTGRGVLHIPLWAGFCLFLAIAVFLLWGEHRAHILGSAPYALLLLCPMIHLLMHRDHRGNAVTDAEHHDHGEAP